MLRLLLSIVVVGTLIQGYRAFSTVNEAGDEVVDIEQLMQNAKEEHLDDRFKTLEKNVTELWSYVFELRGALIRHLKFLRQHQVALENSVHILEHHARGDLHTAHPDSHHHSTESHVGGDYHGDHHTDGEHHHSSEQHSHSGGGEHSHGDESHHHHSSEQHSHSSSDHSEDHSHSVDSHSHSVGGHSHSVGGHSHSDGSHSHGDGSHSHSDDSHSHGGVSHADHDHSHKNSEETEDLTQQTQQKPQVEPLVLPASTTQDPYKVIGLDMFDDNTIPNQENRYHHRLSSSSRNRSVVVPKYSEYNLYHFAICDMKPNRAIAEDKQQNVFGQVSFWQKKTGGPLNIHVKVQGFQMEGHNHDDQQQQQHHQHHVASTTIDHRHGFHVHESSDMSNGCQSCGPHYNPKSVAHGGPDSFQRHVGDLGNIACDDQGVANIIFSDSIASLYGPYSIVDKSLVIHSKADDYGKVDDAESVLSGNAGSRIACCVIEKVAKLPIRTYKAIKTAKQFQNR